MKFIALTLVIFLAGCSLTYEEKLAIAAAMNSAGQGMAQETERMKQRQHELNLQNSRNNQRIAPMPINCFTEYDALARVTVTKCL
jgi:hypothetical protein